MANRYWVGGSGTWDTSSTTHWSATSGGSAGASVPTASDNVFFDQNPAYTVTCNGSITCLNITHNNPANATLTLAVSSSADLTVSGSFNIVSYTSWSANLSVKFNSTSTGNTLFVSPGISCFFNSNFTFDGVGGEWILTSDIFGYVGSAQTLLLTNGTLRLAGYTFGCNKFATGTGTKTLDFGTTGNVQIANTSSGTILDTGTNLANTSFINPGSGTGTNSGTFVIRPSAVSITQQLFVGAVSESNSYSVQIGNIAGNNATISFTSGDKIKNLIFNDTSITFSNVAITIFGNLLGYGMGTLAAGSNAWTFGATSGTQAIYSSTTINNPVIFAGVGATFLLNSNFSVAISQSTTLTGGTLSLSTYTLTTGPFVVSGSSTKSINFGTGSIQNAGSGSTTVWDSSAGLTGFSSSGTGGVVVVGATGTKTINTGAIPEAAAVNFTLQPTGGTVTFTAGNTVKNLTLNGTFTLSNIAITIYGNATVTSVTTLTAGSNAWTFGATSGTQTISNPWGSTWTFPLNFNGAGGTFQLQSAITTNRAVAGVITLTNGTLDLNGYTLTISAVTLSTFLTAAGTKNITFNGGSIVIATPITTAFNNAAPTGFTTTKGTGVGSISMSGTTAKTFVGGGSTFACALNNGGAGALTVSGANTFNDITSTYAASTAANTITFPASTTTTVSALTGTGASGRLFTLNSGTVGTQATIALSGGGSVTTPDYLNVTDLAFTPFATDGTAPYKWNGGANSTNGGNVTGILLAASTVIAYALASGTSFTTPADWNNSNNTIHIFGAGGGGGGGRATTSTNHAGGGGGGGGGYTKLTNQTISGAISYAIGAGGTAGASAGGTGGTGGTTTWNTTNTALGGTGGSTTAAPTSAGGLGGVGITFTGGAGGAGSTNTTIAATGSGGGGGAAGPNGIGGAGGAGVTSIGGGGGGNGGGTAGTAGTGTGGPGGNNSLGTGGGAARTAGSFGGGGGGSSSSAVVGGIGGFGIDILNTIGGGGGAGGISSSVLSGTTNTAYGGGGAGGATNNSTTTNAGGAGGSGLIVVVYTPGSGPVTNKASFFFMY